MWIETPCTKVCKIPGVVGILACLRIAASKTRLNEVEQEGCKRNSCFICTYRHFCIGQLCTWLLRSQNVVLIAMGNQCSELVFTIHFFYPTFVQYLNEDSSSFSTTGSYVHIKIIMRAYCLPFSYDFYLSIKLANQPTSCHVIQLIIQ